MRYTFFLVLGLAACATGGQGVECHGVQWYRIGYEDGLKSARGERERYAAACWNDFNADQYERGFQDGIAKK